MLKQPRLQQSEHVMLGSSQLYARVIKNFIHVLLNKDKEQSCQTA